MRNPRHPSQEQQRGVSLLVALVFLVLLTLLGITVITNNSLQIRMAGSVRQKDLAFQAAEYALKVADGAIRGDANGGNNAPESRLIEAIINADPGVPDSSGFDADLAAASSYVLNKCAVPNKDGGFTSLECGVCHQSNDMGYWNASVASSEDPCLAFDWKAAWSKEVSGNLFEKLSASNPRYTIERMPNAPCTSDQLVTCYFFRVTARGVGTIGTAAVILQSMYEFKR